LPSARTFVHDPRVPSTSTLVSSESAPISPPLGRVRIRNPPEALTRAVPFADEDEDEDELAGAGALATRFRYFVNMYPVRPPT
jgi:hypothetical protein